MSTIANQSWPQQNPRHRRRGGRRRRTNPWGIDTSAAIGLGAVGAAIGIASSFAASATDRVWTRVLVSGLTGGATGAVLGALLPKKRSANPLKNPIGTATAIAAGAAIALVPVAVATKVLLPKSAGRSAAPTVRGKMGGHVVDIYRNGPTWAWRAPMLAMAGAGDSRRDAIVNAYSDLVMGKLQPTDGITLDFFPEQIQVQISETSGGTGPLSWRWTSTSGDGANADNRGAALTAALEWINAHSDLD